MGRNEAVYPTQLLVEEDNHISKVPQSFFLIYIQNIGSFKNLIMGLMHYRSHFFTTQAVSGPSENTIKGYR